MLLFKYLSPIGIQKVLDDPKKITLRFSLPSSYNDPYELFLQPDQPIDDEEIRAFYDFFIGEVVESPMTCFSRCPDSVVLWAHYAREGSGVCLAFDEDQLTDQYSIAFIDDVTYSNEPAKIEYFFIQWAFTTGKRRHTLALLEEASRAAFFTKRSDWQYEKERRLVVLKEELNSENGLLLSKVEPKVLKYIILGANVEPEIEKLCNVRAEQYGIPLIQLKIGKKYFSPFFYSTNTGTLVWNGETFEKYSRACNKCHEPATILDSGVCEWCKISDEMRYEHGSRSLFLSTLTYGYDKGIPFRFAGLKPRGRAAKDKR